MPLRMVCALWISFALCVVVRAQERSLTGEYRNYAEGFAVRIPGGLHGVTGNQAGPERGVEIPLPSGGSVTVYGEPNSLEYKTPAEGIHNSLSTYHPCGEPIVSVARIGSVRGAKGRLVCGERVIVMILAFRPGGGPNYWLRLETTKDHAKADEAALETISLGFKIIAWR